MLVYNTTYHIDSDQEQYFLIWMKEFYLPQIARKALLHSPRMLRVTSHRDEGVCYCVQLEAESSALLHRWHREQGAALNEELNRLFKDRVVGFATLMEVVDL